MAEDKVKVGGDNSSASLKQIITLVKAHNDELAYTSSTIAAIIGVIAILIGVIVSWWVIRQITRPIDRNLGTGGAYCQRRPQFAYSGAEQR